MIEFAVMGTGLGLEIWRCRSLRLTDEARKLLFPTAKIWGVDDCHLPGGCEQEGISSEDEKGGAVSQIKTEGTVDQKKDADQQQNLSANSKDHRLMIHELNITGAEVDSSIYTYFADLKRPTFGQVVLYPLGTGLLILHLDWLPHGTGPLSM